MTKIELRRISKVTAMDNFTLECEMENKEVYKYDMSFLQNEKGEIIEPLKDINFFKQVWPELGSLEWPNGFAIHGNTIARDGELIKKTT